MVVTVKPLSYKLFYSQENSRVYRDMIQCIFTSIKGIPIIKTSKKIDLPQFCNMRGLNATLLKYFLNMWKQTCLVQEKEQICTSTYVSFPFICYHNPLQ